MKKIGIVLAGMVIALTGCSTPEMPEFTTKAFAERVSEAKASEPSRAVVEDEVAKPKRKPSDLETGSITNKQSVGDMTVITDYWTKKVARKWEGESGRINMSLMLNRPNAKTDVKITKFKVWTDDGTVLLEDLGEFIVTPPYSYTTVVETPETSEKDLRISVQVDMLVETEADSGKFFRQTVFDGIRLTFKE